MDAAFYTELWCEEGGGLDQIESCGVWPKGSRVIMQHDGAKAHTEETVQGTIEDSYFTGDGALSKSVLLFLIAINNNVEMSPL